MKHNKHDIQKISEEIASLFEDSEHSLIKSVWATLSLEKKLNTSECCEVFDLYLDTIYYRWKRVITDYNNETKKRGNNNARNK